MSVLAQNLLTQRRKRLVGSLMMYLEQNVYPSLTSSQRNELRLKVLSDVNAYHDVVLDLVKASVSDGSIVNDEALELLARIDGNVRNLRGA